MGAIRGILLVFVCVLLFFSLVITNLFLTFSMSLEYNNVKVEIGNFVDNLLEEKDLESSIGDEFELMNIYCQYNSDYVFEYNGSGYNFEIPCTVISQGPNSVASYIAEDFVEEIYYNDYNCTFFNCLQEEGPFFLISERSMNYWNNKFYLMMFVSLILIGLTFLLTEKKSNALILSGVFLVIVSLLFSKINSILSFFSDDSLLKLLGLFFNKSYNAFAISLTLGIIFLAGGILWKLFKIGFKVSDILSKFSKKDKASSKEKKKLVTKSMDVKQTKFPDKKDKNNKSK